MHMHFNWLMDCKNITLTPEELSVILDKTLKYLVSFSFLELILVLLEMVALLVCSLLYRWPLVLLWFIFTTNSEKLKKVHTKNMFERFVLICRKYVQVSQNLNRICYFWRSRLRFGGEHKKTSTSDFHEV